MELVIKRLALILYTFKTKFLLIVECELETVKQILIVACKNVTLFKKSFVFPKKSEVKVSLEILKTDLKAKSPQHCQILFEK